MKVLSLTNLSAAGIAAFAIAVGCGGESTDPSPGRGGSAGTSATGGTGGSSATGGTGGSSATGGTGGSTGGTGGSSGTGGTGGGGVNCNGVECMPTVFGGMTLPACCTTQSTCGIDVGGMCIQPPMLDGGVTDPTCPSVTLGGGAFTFNGCCLASAACGLSLPTLGCISYDEARAAPIVGTQIGPLLPEGGAPPCVPPP